MEFMMFDVKITWTHLIGSICTTQDTEERGELFSSIPGLFSSLVEVFTLNSSQSRCCLSRDVD